MARARSGGGKFISDLGWIAAILWYELVLCRPDISPISPGDVVCRYRPPTTSLGQRPPALVEYLWYAFKKFLSGLFWGGLGLFLLYLAHLGRVALGDTPDVIRFTWVGRLTMWIAAYEIVIRTPAVFLWAMHDHAAYSKWVRERE